MAQSNFSIEHRETFIHANGLNLCLCEWGPKNSPLVLCVHGAFDHALVWEPIAYYLVSKGKRVISFDLRGHGKSFHAPDYENYDFVRDLEAVINIVGSEPLILVGHSLGAMISATYMAIHQKKDIAGLVLIEPVVIPMIGESAQKNGKEKLNEVKFAKSHPIFPNERSAAEHIKKFRTFLKKDFAFRLSQRILKPASEGGFTWTWDFELRRQSFMAFEVANFNMMFYEDLFSRINCPITWIKGNTSRINYKADHVILNRIFKNSSIVEIEGGHHVHIEAPHEIAGVLEDYLKRENCRFQTIVTQVSHPA